MSNAFNKVLCYFIAVLLLKMKLKLRVKLESVRRKKIPPLLENLLDWPNPIKIPRKIILSCIMSMSPCPPNPFQLELT